MRLKAVAAGCVLALAAGCGTATIQVQSGGVPAPGFVAPGTSVSGGSVSVNFPGGSTLAALLGIAALGAVAHGADLPAPRMDETRRVQLVDCTRPIEDWSANLRCR